MNYRHAYHAGNFADVVKHAALSRLVEYLKLKDKAFRVIDTHAGTGLYDLSSQQAQKTGEWHDGIGRLLGLTPPASLREAPSPLRGGRDAKLADLLPLDGGGGPKGRRGCTVLVIQSASAQSRRPLRA